MTCRGWAWFVKVWARKGVIFRSAHRRPLDGGAVRDGHGLSVTILARHVGLSGLHGSPLLCPVVLQGVRMALRSRVPVAPSRA